MNSEAWLRRLRNQCPGWLFYKIVGSEVDDWCAVPAPTEAGPEFLNQPDLWKAGLINAPTPGELRRYVQERYGWYDYCESCGVLARKCGHRQPEQRSNP